MNELHKTISEKYPNLTKQYYMTITLSIFKRMSELKFPLTGDDQDYVNWFNKIYQPTVKQEEADVRVGDWY